MITCYSLKEKYRCCIRKDEFDIISDATVEKGGEGIGFRPHEILESAYASCLNMFIQMQCQKMGIPFYEISVCVNLRRFDFKTVFNYSIEFSSNITDLQKEIIIKIIKESPVRKTLSKPIFFKLKKY